MCYTGNDASSLDFVMWPLDLPASDVLKLPRAARPAWAVFDSAWYLRGHPEAASDNPDEILEYYLVIGQSEGHSPNPLFDERWHRAAYPRIAEAISSGRYASAFDAYCRRGCLDRSPHWLFDELSYRDRYADLTDEVLSGAGLFNGYDHYLRYGVLENRIGHPVFDQETYLSNFDVADILAVREQGVYQHYLNRIESGEPELRTSIYFDPVWYVERYPEVAKAIAGGLWKSALQHYLCNDTPTAFDPLESFSEAHYLGRDPGLAEVIASGHFRNGYMHFLKFGARELRSPAPTLDLAWYAAQPAARSDLETGRVANAFAHWLTFGHPGEKDTPETERISVPVAHRLVQLEAAALLPIAGRFGYRFDSAIDAEVSVVVAVRNGFAATMASIASLCADRAESLELIIVDRGSDDETRAIGSYLPGAKLLRFDSDIGWAKAVDAGQRLATGRFTLFLSADARIAPGSIARARARLMLDQAVGAVGGITVQSVGVIGQAGGIIWNNGRLHDYQRGRTPLAPEANFVRAVDFVSSSFLLVRSALLGRLGGFDHECGGGYEAADLCLRIAAAGLQVVYDPSVMIFDDCEAIDQATPNPRFLEKHAAFLARSATPGGEAQIFARHAAGPVPPRVLFIEDTVPLRRTGSGFVRSNDIVHVMASLGFSVTVFPVNGCSQDRARVFGDMPESAEVMHDRDINGLAAFIELRRGYYDLIWVARAHNLDRIRAWLLEDGPPIVLDTEAVAALREAEQARLAGKSYDVAAGMRSLLGAAARCTRVVAVTEAEAETLRDHGVPDVAVVGHMVEPRPTIRRFLRRAGILFVGAFHTMDCPNLDGLTWFVDEVLPLIEAELGWETRLTIAGFMAPGVNLDRFENHPRITLRGAVADLENLYDGNRVFIAPTRFAAGAPYKVFEAASRGVPVVATKLLCRQLGWTEGEEILSAGSDDPATFAAGVVSLHRDADLWRTVREAALWRLERENAKAGFTEAVASVLAMP